MFANIHIHTYRRYIHTHAHTHIVFFIFLFENIPIHIKHRRKSPYSCLFMQLLVIVRCLGSLLVDITLLILDVPLSTMRLQVLLYNFLLKTKFVSESDDIHINISTYVSLSIYLYMYLCVHTYISISELF